MEQQKRYAVIARVRKQVASFINNPKIINQKFNLIVDLENHPQKNEIQIDWFYDEETNTFSAEGEVVYPEFKEPEQTQLDRIEAAVAKSNDDIAAEAVDEYTLELIERGVL